MATKLIKQQVSENRTLIKIIGDTKQEIVQELYRFINFGTSVCIRNGTEIEDDTGLTYLNVLENEGYMTVDTQKFIQTLINIELFRLSRKTQHEKHISEKMLVKAQRLGQKVWESIEENNIFKDATDPELGLT